MNAQLPIARLTDDEFERLIGKGAPEVLGRVELRNGALHRIDPMNAQYHPHASMKAKLFLELNAAITTSGLALGVLTECSVRFGGGFSPLPDVIVWVPSAAKKSLPGEDVRLVVEVADMTQDDDLGAKRDDYAKAGAPELWVVDLKARTLHRFSGPKDGVYPPATLFREGENVISATLPGIAIRLTFPM